MTSVLYAALLDEDAISIYNREVVDDAPAATAPALTLRARVECKGGPMWIAANPAASRLYACTLKTSELVSFRVDAKTGDLAEISRIPYPDPGPTDPHGNTWTGSPCPCYITTDASGATILTAFYTAGMVTVHKTNPETGAAVLDGANVHKTTHGCHSVQLDPVNNVDCFVPCVAAWAGDGADPNNTILEGNRIFHFTLDDCGVLSPGTEPVVPPPTIPTQDPRFGCAWDSSFPTNRFGTRPELGPRHMAFHPTLRTLYTSNEQGNSVTGYCIGKDGKLELLGTASTVPDDFSEKSHTSEIRVHPSGDLAFCTNRGHNSIASISLDPSGLPAPGPRAETSHIPQALELDPSGTVLYAAGTGKSKDIGVMTTFLVDKTTGKLVKLREDDIGKNPIRLLVLTLPREK